MNTNERPFNRKKTPTEPGSGREGPLPGGVRGGRQDAEEDDNDSMQRGVCVDGEKAVWEEEGVFFREVLES